jgi:hypothetical protein
MTTLEEYAFGACSALKSVIIPNSVTTIGRNAFLDCTGLETLTLGNSVTTIEMCAFEHCTSLASVTIPNSVTTIEGNAFSGCNGLTDVYVDWPSPLPITSNVFSFATLGNITLHVPEGTESAYSESNNWKEFRIVSLPPTAGVSLEAQKESGRTMAP